MDYIKEIEINLNKKAVKNFLKLQVGDIPNSYSKIINTNKIIKYNFKTDYKKGIKNFIKWFKEYYSKKID